MLHFIEQQSCVYLFVRIFLPCTSDCTFIPYCTFIKGQEISEWAYEPKIVLANLFQKYQLTHNMTKDCPVNYQFSTWKFRPKIPSSEHSQNMTICVHNKFWQCSDSELGIFMYWSGNLMDNLLSYCGLVDARKSTSEKGLPVYS